MQFNKPNYLKTKEVVIDLIKKTHDWENTEGFIADGIICPDIYEKQELKILVILAESYGYNESGAVDIETQLKDDILGVGHPQRQTTKKISSLMWLIYKASEIGRKLVFDDMLDSYETNDENFKELQDSLSRIAWINVKKASRPIDTWGNGATNQNDAEVYGNCIKNKELLKLQIESICPNLIIACGHAVFNGLFDTGLLGDNITRGKKDTVQINNLGQRIIQVNHPSHYATWGYESILKKHEIIYDSFQ